MNMSRKRMQTNTNLAKMLDKKNANLFKRSHPNTKNVYVHKDVYKCTHISETNCKKYMSTTICINGLTN